MATGIAFPLEIVKGQLKTHSDFDLVYGHVLATVQTEVRERLGLINFGLIDYTFASYFDFLRVGNDIRERLESAIPDAGFNVLADLRDDGIGTVAINISYQDEDDQDINLEFG